MNGWLTKVCTRMLAIPVDTNGWCVVANDNISITMVRVAGGFNKVMGNTGSKLVLSPAPGITCHAG